MNERVDLDIKNYKLVDIFKLFELKFGDIIYLPDIKRSKMLVMSMHPDKSNLSSQYFVFYKKAFEQLCEFYNCQTHVKKENSFEIETEKKDIDCVREHLSKFNTKQFNKIFNELYEDNNKVEIDSKNDWFKDENVIQSQKSSCIHTDIESIRKNKQRESCEINSLNIFDDFPTFDNHQGSAIYKTKLRNDGKESYIYSNPSSKLLYDDLRKVHLNETIINVTTDTIAESIDCNQLRKQREKYYKKYKFTSSRNLKPNVIDEQVFIDKHKEKIDKMFESVCNSYENSKEWDSINKKVLSRFMQISN